jgi:hypothetical protein
VIVVGDGIPYDNVLVYTALHFHRSLSWFVKTCQNVFRVFRVKITVQFYGVSLAPDFPARCDLSSAFWRYDLPFVHKFQQVSFFYGVSLAPDFPARCDTSSAFWSYDLPFFDKFQQVLLHGVKASVEGSTKLGHCLVWPLLLVKCPLQPFTLPSS